MKKVRIDEWLVRQGYFPTTDKAKRAIMAGIVFADNIRVDTAGTKVADSVLIEIKGKKLPYVGRGGLKLEKALRVFPVTVQQKVMIDIGASTGGFTDCALQNGAKLVYAVDVGYNQLAWKLRQDERVVVLERTNFRHMIAAQLEKGLPQFATVDVSFISLQLILPVLKTMLLPNSDCILLIKPQFEAAREEVGEKGIVRDKIVHVRVIESFIQFAKQEGYTVCDISYSPITGGDGNIEFLAHVKWEANEQVSHDIDVLSLVNTAHEHLRKK